MASLVRGLWASDAWSAYLLEAGILAGIFAAGVVVVALTFKWE